MKKHSVITSLRIYRTTKAKLDDLKIHPKQSYDEIINIIIEDRANFQKLVDKANADCESCGDPVE